MGMSYGVIPPHELPARTCLWGARASYIQIGSGEDRLLAEVRRAAAACAQMARSFESGMETLNQAIRGTDESLTKLAEALREPALVDRASFPSLIPRGTRQLKDPLP